MQEVVTLGWLPVDVYYTMGRQREQCGCENPGCIEAEGGRPPLDTGCAAQVARNTRSSARSQMNFAALGFQAIDSRPSSSNARTTRQQRGARGSSGHFR